MRDPSERWSDSDVPLKWDEFGSDGKSKGGRTSPVYHGVRPNRIPIIIPAMLIRFRKKSAVYPLNLLRHT